jgi:PWWP domain
MQAFAENYTRFQAINPTGSDQEEQGYSPFIIKELLESGRGQPTKTPAGFNLGQIVWAKVKGHTWWPAYLIKILPSNHRKKAHAKANFIKHPSQ